MHPVWVEVDQGRRPFLADDASSEVEDPVRKSADLSLEEVPFQILSLFKT
jgi:hypothetical protein